MRSYKVCYLGHDREVVLALERALSGTNMKFMSAFPDGEGVNQALEFGVDIILWDKDNTPLDEPVPIERIRKMGFASQPIMVVVSEGDSESAIKSLAAGASDFIYKPIKANPLPRIIAGLNVGQHQKRVGYYVRMLEEANEGIKTILASLKDPAYIVSPEYQILYMNPAAEEIFGEGLRGGACYQVFYDRIEPCDVCRKGSGSARWRSVLKNGKTYRFISVMVKNPRGEIQKLAVGVDVTPGEEVKKIHQTFISNVSHDLRTPLAAIDQYVSILRDGLGGELSEEQVKYLDIIRKNSFRLRNLIENLIDANNILSGKFKMKMEVMNLKDIVKIVESQLEEQARGKGITFGVQVPDDLPPIYADASRIAQVIANLAGNSIKFTEQGVVQIRAGFMPRDEGRIIVSVEDSGIGIPREDLGKIFDLFYRVESDKVYVEEGAGLGLSISREIVRAHGGTLWVESMEGMGSAFHFALPVYKSKQVASQTPGERQGTGG
ncbi:MAG: ATP-binding protein [Actinomycetota bacterium]|nr:ATP-binding protein [Actinomycetota bacterium]